MKSDRRFGQFVRQCSENPLLKKKGVAECILFVTTRCDFSSFFSFDDMGSML
jgi:hypothetical protein